MNAHDYWLRRQLEREKHWHELTTAELKYIKKYYKESLYEIQREAEALYGKFARENHLPLEEARRLLRGEEFRQWRMSLLEYVKESRADAKVLRELNTLAMRSRINRLDALHAKTLMELADLSLKLHSAADSLFFRAYAEYYYENLYDLHKSIGLYMPPTSIDRKRIEAVMQTAWSGKNYSARIWANQTKLAKELRATVLRAVHRGDSVRQLSKNLARRMEVGYSSAERLIRTELNAFETKASADAMLAADCTHYQFMATLDRRTCARCGEHDGEVYKLAEMNQGENAPPLHARCRCTIVAFFDSERKRIAKDSHNKRVILPEDITYSQWRANILKA